MCGIGQIPPKQSKSCSNLNWHDTKRSARFLSPQYYSSVIPRKQAKPKASAARPASGSRRGGGHKNYLHFGKLLAASVSIVMLHARFQKTCSTGSRLWIWAEEKEEEGQRRWDHVQLLSPTDVDPCPLGKPKYSDRDDDEVLVDKVCVVLTLLVIDQYELVDMPGLQPKPIQSMCTAFMRHDRAWDC